MRSNAIVQKVSMLMMVLVLAACGPSQASSEGQGAAPGVRTTATAVPSPTVTITPPRPSSTPEPTPSLWTEPTPAIRQMMFEGFYMSEFETSSFVPCPDRNPDYGRGYWLGSKDEAFWNQYQALRTAPDSEDVEARGPTVYVRFIGDLIVPAEGAEAWGGFGHLGQYSHEVVVTRLLAMSLDGQCE